MATKTVEQESISTKLISHWEQVSQKVLALAQAMPAEKFNYRPAGDVRTFADVLRHVAFWNNYAADSARGKNPDGAANELPQEEFSTRSQIIEAVRRSAEKATDAFKERALGMSPELAETLVTFIEHNCEHYGQLVVYARLNAIVPPATRG
jgi:uncharacterized damage-inducible protein DinB